MADKYTDATTKAKRSAYAKARATGKSQAQSAILAGFSEGSKPAKIERSAVVQAELAAIRAETARNLDIKPEDVAAGFKRAADLAETLGDVAGMVASWRELGKLLGHYAPEVKKVEKAISKRDLKDALDMLTDDELRKLANGRVIEGEVTETQLLTHAESSDTPAD